jgi:hypothetical protein
MGSGGTGAGSSVAGMPLLQAVSGLCTLQHAAGSSFLQQAAEGVHRMLAQCAAIAAAGGH